MQLICWSSWAASAAFRYQRHGNSLETSRRPRFFRFFHEGCAEGGALYRVDHPLAARLQISRLNRQPEVCPDEHKIVDLAWSASWQWDFSSWHTTRQPAAPALRSLQTADRNVLSAAGRQLTRCARPWLIHDQEAQA